jgi:ubiquinone/menaquinone biosynthesis C-methylase UbiE
MREEVAERVLPLARSSRRVLDVGCGSGWWLERLAAEGIFASGVDLLPERVTAASARVPAARIQLADGRALPFTDDSFDLVTLFTVLSSMTDRDAARTALAEARRVSAGHVAIWDLRVANPVNRATIRLSRADYERVLGRDARFERITLVPPVARRVTPALYGRLAAIPILTTHWLITSAAGRRRS